MDSFPHLSGVLPFVLPEGTRLPPLPYLISVLIASLLVAGYLFRQRRGIRITDQLIVALAPWMAVGAGLYALRQVDAVPRIVAPLTGSPTVYLTIFVIVGLLFSVIGHRDPGRFTTGSGPWILLLTGTVSFAFVLGGAAWVALERPPVHVFWPGAAFLGALLITGLAWVLARGIRPIETEWVGMTGALCVFGHALDGLSTAVGIEVLGVREQTPLSRLIIDIGGGGLFVLVKIGIALLVVRLLADYVNEVPTEGYLLLGIIAAVGLGPGIHNVILFIIAS